MSVSQAGNEKSVSLTKGKSLHTDPRTLGRKNHRKFRPASHDGMARTAAVSRAQNALNEKNRMLLWKADKSGILRHGGIGTHPSVKSSASDNA